LNAAARSRPDSGRKRLSGFTQGQVAKRMDMHRPTVSEIEAGNRRVSADELKQFAGCTT